MQLPIQIRIVVIFSCDFEAEEPNLPKEKARTQPLLIRPVAMLRSSRKKPQLSSLSGCTILHGPSFRNFAMPRLPDNTEMENVVQNMAVLGIPRKFVCPPKKRSGSWNASANRIKTVGTASMKGSGKVRVEYEFQ